jgi:NAD(P) transhydrogenase subunit alpha
VVEAGAGESAFFPDSDYEKSGCLIAGDDVYQSELVTTIELAGVKALRAGSTVLGLLHPLERPDRLAELAQTGVNALAFELVPRSTRAQMVDALSSQATVSGYRAVLEAATVLDRFFPMLTTAAGTVRPASVLVLGAGVAGLSAVATARRLGAVVAAFDVRAAAEEQVQSLGARFITFEDRPEDASTAGGYARELEAGAQRLLVDSLAPHVVRSDVVIATAAVPGRPAPRLIAAETVEAMRPGAVIVDVAAGTGGNCELTVPGKATVHGDVTILGYIDLASRVPGHASQMYARNVAAFVELLSHDGHLSIDLGDDIVSATCAVYGGEVRVGAPSLR